MKVMRSSIAGLMATAALAGIFTIISLPGSSEFECEPGSLAPSCHFVVGVYLFTANTTCDALNDAPPPQDVCEVRN